MVVTEKESLTTLRRILVRLKRHFPEVVGSPEWEAYQLRLEENFPTLFKHLMSLYGERYDFFFHVEDLLERMARVWFDRPPDLKSSDAMREADPRWFQNGRLIGGMAYVDLFAGDLAGLREKIPYLQEIGITYLHLMPIYQSPDGDDDGGYAVSSYREIDPNLGVIEELRELATEFRAHGISLALDFVFNHTSDEHEWAKRAIAGETDFQNYYYMFENREKPDAYEQHLRAIFPDEHPGNFTYQNNIKRWVWTTFHTYQWDLNYRNPEVLNAMAEEMLFLANVGVEVLRMDAVPFLWKQMGTNCENLDQAHTLIQIFNAIARIAAPGMIFKSEAIVAPDEIKKYIGSEECQISYNPLLMALLWESIATRDARLLRHSMQKRFEIDPECAWVNYVRSHDDIGWGFDNADTWEMGINPEDHRRFLTNFYVGRHTASFAQGELFQEDPTTGDARVCGTTASLCGLERALDLDDSKEIEFAIRRILLLDGVIFTIGGIPLIYLGDEIGMLNDPNYKEDHEKMDDSRWLHRPPFDWEKAQKRTDSETPEANLYQGLLKLVQMRKNNSALARGDTEIVDAGNDHVFAYFRTSPEQSILCLANFSDQPQSIPATRLRQLGLRKALVDIIAGQTVLAAKQLELEPLQFSVLLRQGG